MKKVTLVFCLFAAVITCSDVFAQTTIKIFDTVLYFDGYAAAVTTPPAPAGVVRHRNDLYARKLTQQELATIGSSLRMNVTIKAACDNYDRIGSVNMALVPKGSATYHPDSVQHIELGRFITPFMNKNKKPDTVPYTYTINNVAHLFRETSITSQYDIWIELEVFGVPYAANTQVAGCAGRNDVFYGSLEFVTNTPSAAESNNVLLPLSFKRSLNNYKPEATDTLGKTTITINFNVAADLTDAAIFLITSNHGANQGGEEYNRRHHYVYIDNTLRLTYMPGSATCEPLRKYNTQGNGIYGQSAKTDAQWQSFSNWCPGDTIPVRRIDLGAVAAGNHSFRIEVPEAKFVNGEGNIPLSLYLHGKTSGVLNVAAGRQSQAPDITIYPNPAKSTLTIEVNGKIDTEGTIQVFDIVGKKLMEQYNNGNRMVLDVSVLPAGVYDVVFTGISGTQFRLASKFLKD